MKIAWFYDFLRKNQFLPIVYTQNGHFSIFVGALTLWRHSDVIHYWLVLILVSMERRCPYLYTGSKFRVIWPSVLIIQRGVATTPLGKYVLEKPSGEQRLTICSINFCHSCLELPSVAHEYETWITFSVGVWFRTWELRRNCNLVMAQTW